MEGIESGFHRSAKKRQKVVKRNPKRCCCLAPILDPDFVGGRGGVMKVSARVSRELVVKAARSG